MNGLGLIVDDPAAADYYEEQSLGNWFDDVGSAITDLFRGRELPEDQAGPPAPGALQLAVNGNENAWLDVLNSGVRAYVATQNRQTTTPIPTIVASQPAATPPTQVVVLPQQQQQAAASKKDIPWGTVAAVGVGALLAGVVVSSLISK